MTNPKLQDICDLDLPILWVVRGTLHVEPKKPVFRTKFFKMTKISPNLLKFEVKTLYHVLCPANEALAKIWSGSGFFRRFSTLLNPDEHRLSINRCQITGSLSGQFSVFPDLPQLIKCMFIFQLFVALLQVVDHPLSHLQFLFLASHSQPFAVG